MHPKEIHKLLRRALHDPDPLERAAAQAELRLHRLPISPMAIEIATTRLLASSDIVARAAQKGAA